MISWKEFNRIIKINIITGKSRDIQKSLKWFFVNGDIEHMTPDEAFDFINLIEKYPIKGNRFLKIK